MTATPVRIIYTDKPGEAFPEYKGKFFVVIGPLEGHFDKADLQDSIECLLRGYNLKDRAP